MGSCASTICTAVTATQNAKDFKPTSGCFVLLQLAEPSVGRNSQPRPNSLPLYMVKAQDTWHSFPSCGFLVDSQHGLGESCSYDVILAGPLPAHLTQQQPENGSAVRVSFEELINCAGVSRIAVAQPVPGFSTTEISRIKAFAHRPGQLTGCSNRARLLSSKGRKVFLPELLGEMLCAAGRMTKMSSGVYGATNGSWAMPDLMFLEIQPPPSLNGSDGEVPLANNERSESGPPTAPRPSRQSGRRAQQGVHAGNASTSANQVIIRRASQDNPGPRHSNSGLVDFGRGSPPRGSPRTSMAQVSPRNSITYVTPARISSHQATSDDGSRGVAAGKNSMVTPPPASSGGSAFASSSYASSSVIASTLGSTCTVLSSTTASASHTTMSANLQGQKLSNWDSVGSDVGTVLQKGPLTVSVSGLSATLAQQRSSGGSALPVGANA